MEQLNKKTMEETDLKVTETQISDSKFRQSLIKLGEVIPSWSSLNRIGHMNILKTSYIWLFLVPITASFLAKLNPPITITLFSHSFSYDLRLPFSWKIFYYSSIAFAFASFIYSTRCPKIVSSYERFSDYLEEGKSGNQIFYTFLKLIKESKFFLFKGKRTIWFIVQKRGLVAQFMNEILAEKIKLDIDYPDKDLLKKKIPEDKIVDAFWFVRNVADNSDPWFRLLSYYVL